MDPKDEGKGFKGLGKLGGSEPPASPVPPPRPAPPPPLPGPSAPRPSPGGTGDGGSKPPPTGSTGCLKVGAVLLVVLLLTGGLGIFLLRTFAPAEDDAAAEAVDAAAEPMLASDDAMAVTPDPDEAVRLAEADVAAAQEQVRLATCLVDAGTRPETGEVLSRTLDVGQHQLTINGGVDDALVKLRDDDGTVLAFYVRSLETAQIDDIPDGTYRVMFAGGSDFSRSCNEFVTGMSVSADPDPVEFAITERDGKRYAAVMEYTLEQSAGGNFEPTVVDPAEFRD